MEFLIENWEVILSTALVVFEVVVRLTPSEKDNSIFNKIKRIIDFIFPNLKKKGGVF